MNMVLTGAEGNFGTEFRKLAGPGVAAVNREGWAHLDDLLAVRDAVVIHAASDLRTRAAEAPARLMDSNVMSTARLLEAAQRHGVRRFVFLSSCAVYGEDMRTGEDSPCCPISINGIGKLLNEKLVAEFCEANGIEYQILRIFNMYGGNDVFSIVSRLEQAARGNRPFVLNNGGVAQRDFIHVADVAAIVLKLVAQPARHAYLNVGTGVATRISALVEWAQQANPSLDIRHAQIRAPEAEYSRADTTRLAETVDTRFLRIADYVRNGFKPTAST